MSNMPSVGSALWRSLRAYQVYGANTDVGKTIASTILCKALRKQSANENICYIKPVSTGPQSEADDLHISRYAKGVLNKCLFQFDDAVSPHIAARSLSVGLSALPILEFFPPFLLVCSPRRMLL